MSALTADRSPARAPRVLAVLALLCALGGLAGAAGAQASDVAKLKASFKPYRLGQETTLELALAVGASDGGVPSPVTSFTTRLPQNLEFISSSLGLAICKPSALLAHGASGCSPNARIGLGSAQAEVPVGSKLVRETAGIEAFVGPAIGENMGVLLSGQASSPVISDNVFSGRLLLESGPLGEGLDTTLPLTEGLPGGPDVSVTKLNLSIGPEHLTYYKTIAGRTVAYRPAGVSLPTSCPRGGFVFSVQLTFQDGTHLSEPSRIACPPRATRTGPPAVR